MKYFLSFALLCMSLFAFCQEGENIAPLQNEAGGEQALTESAQRARQSFFPSAGDSSNVFCSGEFITSASGTEAG